MLLLGSVDLFEFLLLRGQNLHGLDRCSAEVQQLAHNALLQILSWTLKQQTGFALLDHLLAFRLIDLFLLRLRVIPG